MTNVCPPCAKTLRTVPPIYDRQLLNASLDEIKSAIRQHKACIAALEKREQEAVQYLARVYPVFTLPNEIVSRIFIECLPSHGRVRPSPIRAPLLLAQICHHWREIALSTCELWTSADVDAGLHLPSLAPRVGTVERLLPLLQTWFSRAQACPLSLTVRSRYEKLPVAIYSIISAFAERLHRVELNLSVDDLRALQQLSISLPHVRQLAVPFNLGAYLALESPFRAITIFPNTPRLQDLAIGQCTISELGIYQNLTRLRLSQASIDQILQILQSRSQITDFTAVLLRPSSSRSFSAPPPLTHIHSLALFEYEGDTVVEVMLGLLTIPNLRRLELGVNKQPPSLLAFLNRSACPLEHLSLGSNFAQDCLAVLPSLKTLEVQVDPRTIIHFREVLEIPTLVPHLHALSVIVNDIKDSDDADPGVDNAKDFDYAAFARSLETRRRQNPNLRSLKLRLYHTFEFGPPGTPWLPKHAREELERLIADGMRIQVNFALSLGWPELADRCGTFP
ncbi:hypothetical protein B0H16DRAFT_1882659 [Mycena metata]|uniref:F-box domain-containing protein n=1 Tax=Mycena metata TaxID=1033252 RepID=A0AAD7JK60_9AGAR|nr:hypothetical protein B0H16DRAFT_1882659 [Mycena metata]